MSSSAWIGLAHRAGSATTALLPGLGRVVSDRVGRVRVWESYDSAKADCDALADRHDAVIEVGKIELRLGVSE